MMLFTLCTIIPGPSTAAIGAGVGGALVVFIILVIIVVVLILVVISKRKSGKSDQAHQGKA
jgi:uncharacterized membrane protein